MARELRLQQLLDPQLLGTWPSRVIRGPLCVFFHGRCDGRKQFVSGARGRALRHGGDSRQRIARPRPCLCKLVDRGIRQDPAARQVTIHRAPLAPGGERTRCRKRRGVKALQSLEAFPGFRGLDPVERDRAELRGLLLEPRAAAGRVEPLLERRRERGQVADVVGGVSELLS